MLLCAGLETGEGRDSMSTIKMKSDGTVITSLRMPVETWQRLKLQAVAERTDMRNIILRSVASELDAMDTRARRSNGQRDGGQHEVN
jgi:hypothetical protein